MKDGHETFKASEEIPKMKELAIEHLETCRECNQRVASHHMGIGEVFSDIEMKQILDMNSAHVMRAEELLDATKAMIEHQNKMFTQLTELVSEMKVATTNLINAKRSALPTGYKIGAGLGGAILTIVSYILGGIMGV